MTKDELRIECKRLWNPTIDDDISDIFKLFKEFFLKSILNHPNKPTDTPALRDARMVKQMMFTKVLHLEQMIQGIGFDAVGIGRLNNITDPTVVASLVRTLFETVGMFNCIFVQPQNDDQRLILYNLWVSSGLNYRQKFLGQLTSQENIQKGADEREQIKKLRDEIESTELWPKISQSDRLKVYNKLSNFEYSLQFEGNKVKGIGGFQNLVELAGVRENIMGRMYTYFSLNAHPSNVAVFQFAEMFKADAPRFREITMFNLSLAFMLISIFIADYIKVFPETLETFNKISLRDQCVINFWNKFSRTEEYSINDCLEQLN